MGIDRRVLLGKSTFGKLARIRPCLFPCLFHCAFVWSVGYFPMGFPVAGRLATSDVYLPQFNQRRTVHIAALPPPLRVSLAFLTPFCPFTLGLTLSCRCPSHLMHICSRCCDPYLFPSLPIPPIPSLLSQHTPKK